MEILWTWSCLQRTGSSKEARLQGAGREMELFQASHLRCVLSLGEVKDGPVYKSHLLSSHTAFEPQIEIRKKKKKMKGI